MSIKKLSKKIKFYSALSAAKLSAPLVKLRGKSSGTSFPGLVANKIDKDFLSGTQFYCKKNIITVTGTNGKTTTSGLIASILVANSETILHNQKGANMPQGIATALAIGINPFKKADYFVLENDEAYLSKIYDKIAADYLVVTNLFQDQADRYGEINATAGLIKTAIDKNPQLAVLLNADDIMLRALYTENTVTFGFEDIVFAEDIHVSHAPAENLYCDCGSPLLFDKNFYAHIGHYRCECGYKRKAPDFSATAEVYHEKTVLKLTHSGKVYDFTVHIPGLYNAYNALAAISMGLMLKVAPGTIQNALDTYHSVFGRAEKIQIKDKPAFVQLIKNSVGASEAIKMVSSEEKSNLLIMINDEYADGRDMSWLWDTDFEELAAYKGKITVSGKRAYDVALRLKYAGVSVDKISMIPDIESAVVSAIDSLPTGLQLHILPCYSALMTMQSVLKKL